MTTHRLWSIWATVLLIISATFAGFSLLQADDRRLRRFVIAVSVLSAIVVAYAGWLGLAIHHGAAGDAPSTDPQLTSAARTMAERLAMPASAAAAVSTRPSPAVR